MKRVKPLQTDEQDVKKFNDYRFLRKLARFAVHLGKPVVEQAYALYFAMRSSETPMKSKIMIVGALLYFVSPIDAIPDLLGPLGFSDDVAVIALVFKQVADMLTDDIKNQASAATDALMQKIK